MKFEINFLFVTSIICFASCVEELPANIEKCKYEDDECLVNTWNKYTKLGSTEGIPGLIPPFEKTGVEKIVVNLGSDTLNFKVIYRNLTVTGLADSHNEKVTGFKRDPKTMSNFIITGIIPFISILGRYEAAGKLLLVPLTGNGEAELQYFNMRYTVTVDTKTEERDGEVYLVITKVHHSYENDRNHYRYENILNNKEISDGVNKLLNENPDVFDKEVKEATSKSFAKVFKQIITPIFKRYPYRSFFLN